jgi:hypothetical protein
VKIEKEIEAGATAGPHYNRCPTNNKQQTPTPIPSQAQEGNSRR